MVFLKLKCGIGIVYLLMTLLDILTYLSHQYLVDWKVIVKKLTGGYGELFFQTETFGELFEKIQSNVKEAFDKKEKEDSIIANKVEQDFIKTIRERVSFGKEILKEIKTSNVQYRLKPNLALYHRSFEEESTEPIIGFNYDKSKTLGALQMIYKSSESQWYPSKPKEFLSFKCKDEELIIGVVYYFHEKKVEGVKFITKSETSEVIGVVSNDRQYIDLFHGMFSIFGYRGADHIMNVQYKYYAQ